MPELDLRDLQTLSDLQAALLRFADGAQTALDSAKKEIGLTQEWLHERLTHWQRQTEEARRVAMAAEAALQRCLASGYQDERGNYHPPDCRREHQALAQAETRLRECERNLHITQTWNAEVRQAVTEYERKIQRLRPLIGGHTEKAAATLMKARGNYESVLAAENMAGIGNVMAGLGISSGLGLYLLKKGADKALGRSNLIDGEAGEGVASDIVEEELAYHPVQFDQRKNGFDDILQTPSGQYVLLESKVTSDGKIKLNQKSYGNHRQCSVGWVDQVARHMASPGSKLYSATNARIGQSILDHGAGNVPMLLAVTDRTTGRMALYQRTGPGAMTADWTLLSGDLIIQIE